MKIVWNCLKNLFVNIKYYFVPLGVAMFFIIIGFSVGIPIVINSIKTTFNGIAAEVGHASFDWLSALNKIFEKIVSIDQSNGLDSVFSTISDKDWVVSTLTEVAGALFGDSVSGQEIVNLIKGCAETITGTIAYIVIMAIIGFVTSFFVIMVAVRKSMTNSGWLKAILFSIVDTALFILFVWIYVKIKPVNAGVKTIINIAYGIGIIIFSFLESYVFYGIKKLKFKEAFNLKNILFWSLGNLITLIAGIGLTILPVVIIPWYGGIILAIPFVEIVFLVIHMNAESYIGQLADQRKKVIKEKKVKETKSA